ncbi:TPA: hypothetical protein HA278_00775 [Candidatus Woesearchaeota archaeon]|nr:hypothetical protein [Candidatus Woesearchaeota archaeon]|tara:strand:- start:532 stop:768 length:237 start_codon:yes stop_codon:yes gene_type:complete
MGASRSIRRKQELKKRKKRKKESKNKLNVISKALNSMPERCNKCDILFDKSNLEFYLEWQIIVGDHGQINLTCPNCGG